MMTFLLGVHFIVGLAMVGAILLQRSEGGGLVSNASSFMTARGSANFLTRLTAILATLFIALSLILAILARHQSTSRSLFDEHKAGEATSQPTTPSEKPAS